MTKLSRAQVVALLQAGGSLQDVLRAAGPDEPMEVLRRCAVVRGWFDGALYEAVLAGGSGVLFADVCAHPDVEGEEGRYRVRAEARARLLGDWWRSGEPPPPALVELSRALADRAPDAVTRLYHLALGEPAAAAELLAARFAEADRLHHLAACRDLVRAVAEGATLGLDRAPDRALDEARYRHQRLLDARALWAPDWYATARYLERAQLSAAFEAFLADPERWIFQLHATGGMGKTMSLRWLVSRRAPGSPRMVCARLDFDRVDALEAREPALLLMRLAEQLDRQLPDAPFARLVQEVARYRVAWAAEASLPPPSPEWVDEVAERFARTLAEAPLDGPVLLVLDTLEEALLHLNAELFSLITLLARVRAVCPAVRLVLAGRYDLNARLSGFVDEFSGVTKHYPLPRFSLEEARRYLVTVRGLPDDGRTAAAAERAGGNPFKLALLADVLRADPSLTADDLRAGADDEVDAIYLIQRVVERIPDAQVRWLLRYGVVPRRLDAAFVDAVMARYLPPAMSGEADYDRPAAHLPRTVRSPESVFPVGLAVPGDARAVWKRLARYAADASWVTVAGDGALDFHPDVRRPMRRILRREPVFALLHGAARDHFAARAEVAEEWVWPAAEAVYHAAWVEGDGAADRWRGYVGRARRADRPDWARALAEVVLALAAEESEAPVSRRFRAEADLALAFAEADMGQQAERRDSRHWLEAEQALARAQEVLTPGPEQRVVEARLLTSKGQPAQARKVLDAALGPTGATDDFTFDLWLAAAEAAEAATDPEVLDLYARAVHWAPAPEKRAEVRLRLARQQMRWDRHEDALASCRAAAAEHDTAEARLLEAAGLLAVGRPGAAAGLFEWGGDAPPWASRRAVSIEILRARAATRLHEPAWARACVEAARELMSRGVAAELGPREEQRLRGALAFSEADLLGLTLDPLGALRALQEARMAYREVGNLAGDAAALLRACQIALRDLDDLREVAGLLAEAERLGLPEESRAAVDFDLVRAEVARTQGETDAACALLDLYLDDPPVLPRARARAALAALACRHRTEEGWRLLLGALGAVQSPGARLRILDDAWRLPSLPAPYPVPVALLEVHDDEPLEGALNTLRRLELRRIAGAAVEPTVLVALANHPSPMVGLLARRAADRALGPDWAPRHQTPPPAAAGPEWARVVDAARIEHAERLQSLQPAAAASILADVELPTLERTTWARRARALRGAAHTPIPSADDGSPTIRLLRTAGGVGWIPPNGILRPGEHPLWHELLAARPDEAVPHPVTGLLSNDASARAALADPFRSLPMHQGPYRLSTEDRQLAAVPWEAGAAQYSVRLVRGAPNVRARSAAGAVRRVLVLQPSESRISKLGKREGPSVARAWSAAGADAAVLTDPDLRSLRHLLEKHRPDTLHIRSGYAARRGDVLLDFDREISMTKSGASSLPDAYSPRALLSVLDVARDTLRLVLLDADLAGGPAERWRQILLRNLFAHELHGQSGLSVLCLGSWAGREDDPSAVAARFLAEKGVSLANTLVELTELVRGTPEGAARAALWTTSA